MHPSANAINPMQPSAVTASASAHAAAVADPQQATQQLAGCLNVMTAGFYSHCLAGW